MGAICELCWGKCCPLQVPPARAPGTNEICWTCVWLAAFEGAEDSALPTRVNGNFRMESGETGVVVGGCSGASQVVGGSLACTVLEEAGHPCVPNRAHCSLASPSLSLESSVTGRWIFTVGGEDCVQSVLRTSAHFLSSPPWLPRVCLRVFFNPLASKASCSLSADYF